MIKHCERCGKQIPRESQVLLCSSCIIGNVSKQKKVEECSFCKTTNCPAWGSEYFKLIDKRIYVDFRADMEANQIDCQFGLLDENGVSDEGTWSNFAIDIKYCPVCGRKLSVE